MLIHRYWTGPNHPPLEPWLGLCLRSLNPGTLVHDWTDSTLPDRIRKSAHDFDHQVCFGDRHIHRSNIVRLELLHEMGGAWYDHDVIPLLPVNSLPLNSAASHKGLCSSFLMFKAGNPQLRAALDNLYDKPESNSHAYSVSGTGHLRSFLTDVHFLEYPFSPEGLLLTNNRPFAVHLSLTHGVR